MDIRFEVAKKTYRVSNDKYQFILSEVKIQEKDSKEIKKGEKIYKGSVYFPSLSGLINRLCMLDLCSKDISTLKELKEELINTRKLFKGILNG